jgi:TatA/E family protein of Tat protein translocase
LAGSQLRPGLFEFDRCYTPVAAAGIAKKAGAVFGDHWFYIVILLLVALVVFGPKRLPELGQSLGKAINEFRHATQSAGEELKSVTSPVQVTPATPSPVVAPEVASEAAAAGRSDPPV